MRHAAVAHVKGAIIAVNSSGNCSNTVATFALFCASELLSGSSTASDFRFFELT